LFRRRDDHGLNSHARAQAKLGEMIRAKVYKKPINHHRYDRDHQTLMECPRSSRDGMESVYFNEIEKDVPNSLELYEKSINHAESDPEIALNDYNEGAFDIYQRGLLAIQPFQAARFFSPK